MTKELSEIAMKIKLLRVQHGYKQREVAEKLGVTKQCYSYYERGERNITANTLSKLAELYQIDSSILFDIAFPTESPLDQDKLSVMEKKLLSLFEQLNLEDQKEILAFTRIKTYKYKDSANHIDLI